MPHLQELWSELDSERDDVEVLCINGRDSAEVIHEYWRENDFSITAVREKRAAATKAFGVQANPTNYVIGPDGKVLWRDVGFSPRKLDELRAAVDSTR